MARFSNVIVTVAVLLVAALSPAAVAGISKFRDDRQCPSHCTRPDCPKTSWYRWLNDNLNQHPWMQVFYWSACATVRTLGGTTGAYAVDYVIHPAWMSMRAWEWYTVLSRFAFDFTLTVLVMLVYLCGGFLPALVWARRYVRWIPVPNAREPVATAASLPQTHAAVEDEPGTCQALVASTGKPCTKVGTSHRDGRQVCGTHAKSRQLTYQG